VSNPSKQKGTHGESELVGYFQAAGFPAIRTSPGMKHDITIVGDREKPLEVLATRPDRGQWLMTMRLEDFNNLYRLSLRQAHVECKRYKKFSHHSIFEDKFDG
jgi:hypothetical protein